MLRVKAISRGCSAYFIQLIKVTTQQRFEVINLRQSIYPTVTIKLLLNQRRWSMLWIYQFLCLIYVHMTKQLLILWILREQMAILRSLNKLLQKRMLNVSYCLCWISCPYDLYLCTIISNFVSIYLPNVKYVTGKSKVEWHFASMGYTFSEGLAIIENSLTFLSTNICKYVAICLQELMDKYR